MMPANETMDDHDDTNATITTTTIPYAIRDVLVEHWALFATGRPLFPPKKATSHANQDDKSESTEAIETPSKETSSTESTSPETSSTESSSTLIVELLQRHDTTTATALLAHSAAGSSAAVDSGGCCREYHANDKHATLVACAYYGATDLLERLSSSSSSSSLRLRLLQHRHSTALQLYRTLWDTALGQGHLETVVWLRSFASEAFTSSSSSSVVTRKAPQTTRSTTNITTTVSSSSSTSSTTALSDHHDKGDYLREGSSTGDHDGDNACHCHDDEDHPPHMPSSSLLSLSLQQQHPAVSIHDRATATQNTLLDEAARQGHLSVVEYCLQQGARPHDRCPRYGWSAWHHAAVQGHTAVLRRFLQHQQQQQQQQNDDHPKNAFLPQRQQRHHSKSICTNNTINNKTRTMAWMRVTPLDLAVWNQHDDCVDLLLSSMEPSSVSSFHNTDTIRSPQQRHVNSNNNAMPVHKALLEGLWWSFDCLWRILWIWCGRLAHGTLLCHKSVAL